jgi:F420-non-reducing hydrogenase small subunit
VCEPREATLPNSRVSLSMYWAAGCGGCEMSVVNLHETLLDVLSVADLVFCPCLMDTKLSDVEAMPDGGIDVTLLNGAMRNEDNAEMARLLRRKSRILVAYGSCASSGSIPGLSNLFSLDDHLRTVYTRQPSLDNPDRILPGQRSPVPEGTLELPALYERVLPLREVVEVDYLIPGCPPESDQVAAALKILVDGTELPPRGSVLGSGPSTVCSECRRRREGKMITELRRTWQSDPDPDLCLLEQGLVCMGVATREGCGALCPTVNMPCIGCYGAPEGVRDQGAAMTGAIGAAIDTAPAKGLEDAAVGDHADEVLDGVPDWVGTFYKFTLPSSVLDSIAPRRQEPTPPPETCL